MPQRKSRRRTLKPECPHSNAHVGAVAGELARGVKVPSTSLHSGLRAPEAEASLHRSASNTRPDIRVCHWPGLSLMYLSTMATSWLGGRGVFAMHSSKLTSIFSLAVRFSAGTSERTAAPKSTRLSTTPVTYEERAASDRARHSLPVMAAAGAGQSGRA